MRTVRLAKVAAQAEVLRLRQLASRTAVRAILGVVAAMFAFAAIAGGHVAIALWLAPRFGPVEAVLFVAGGDLLIAIVFGAVAATKGPGRVEREAMEVRRAAQLQLQRSFTMTSLAMPVAQRFLGRTLFAVARNAFSRGGSGKR